MTYDPASEKARNLAGRAPAYRERDSRGAGRRCNPERVFWMDGKGKPMRDFIVTGSYTTWSGNRGAFRYVIPANDEDDAFGKTKARAQQSSTLPRHIT